PIDEAIEVLADAGFGSAAVSGLEKNVDGPVELRPCRFDVAQFESFLSCLEMSFGFDNQVGDWISGRFDGGRGRCWNVLRSRLSRSCGRRFTKCRAASRKQDDGRHDRPTSQLARKGRRKHSDRIVADGHSVSPAVPSVKDAQLFSADCVKIRWASPISRAAGVMMARSETTSFWPVRRAFRTSSSQTKSRTAVATFAGGAGGGFEAPASGRYPRDPRNWSIREVSASALMPLSRTAASPDFRGDDAPALSKRLAVGLISQASRLMFRRCRGEILSEVMLPP